MKRTAILLSALFGSLAFSQETLIKVRVEEEGGKEEVLPVEVKRRCKTVANFRSKIYICNSA
jgi:hypothetical protein